MSRIERSPERDEALVALMTADPFPGWNLSGLRQAAGEHADLLFLGGAAEMVEASIDLADRRMEAEAAAIDMEGWRVPERVRGVIALRFRQNMPFKLAIRRALGVMALPGRGLMAARATARTVDAIWHAAKDQAADFSWYTKRATLAPVYAATLVYWLADRSEDNAATLQFLDRRLEQVAMIGKARRKLFTRAA